MKDEAFSMMLVERSENIEIATKFYTGIGD